MSTDSHDKDQDHDRSYENESTRDHTPMVILIFVVTICTHIPPYNLLAFAATRFASVIIACLILLPIGICTD